MLTPYPFNPALTEAAERAALDAWMNALCDGACKTLLHRLSEAHTRAYDTHMKALKAEYIPASNAPQKASLEAGRDCGHVTRWDAEKGYGYIRVAIYGELYFRRENLRHLSMPLAVGDQVTFCIKESMGEYKAQPKALDIVTEGYIPPARAAYQPDPDRVARMDAVKASRRAAKQSIEARRANQLDHMRAILPARKST